MNDFVALIVLTTCLGMCAAFGACVGAWIASRLFPINVGVRVGAVKITHETSERRAPEGQA